MRFSFCLLFFVISSLPAFAQRVLPKVLVNHDLYSHTLQPQIENGANPLSPKSQGHRVLLDQLSRAESDVLSKPETRFTLNLSYGSHLLSYWSQNLSYKEWLCETAGGVLCRSSFLRSQDADNLIAGKLEGRNLLYDFVTNGRPESKSVSFRMNDHHHMENPEEFFSAPISPHNRMRRLSAMSPEYLQFLKIGKVLRSRNGSQQRGQIGSGPVCDLKSKYLFLDFSDPGVRSFKLKKIASLIRSPGVQNVELDFTRSACFFPLFSSLKAKQDAMSSLLTEADRIRDHWNQKTGRYVELTIRVPHDVDVKHTGLNLSIMAARQQVDAIILGRSFPYLDPSVLPPSELNRDKRKKIKLYRELYHIGDAEGSVRRNAVLQEVYTAALQAYNFGFDGVSLFNFQYAFGDNASLPGKLRYNWGTLLACVTSKDCLEKQKRSYFYSRKNSQASKLTVSTSSPGIIRVLVKDPDKTPTSRKRAYLRIQAENSADDMKLRRGRVWVVVNGNRHNLSNVTRLLGVDPASHYPTSREGEDYWKSWKGVRGSKHGFIPLSSLRSGMNIIRVYRSGVRANVPIRASLIFD